MIYDSNYYYFTNSYFYKYFIIAFPIILVKYSLINDDVDDISNILLILIVTLKIYYNIMRFSVYFVKNSSFG